MYEPPSSPNQNATAPASQWAPYEQSYFVPPRDDFAPEPLNVPPPPPGRMYGMYRQPPTWQHASMMGLGSSTFEDVVASLLTSWAAIAGGGLVGYFLTGDARGVGGGALAVMGASQIPQMFKAGGLTRLVIAAGAFAGAYWCLSPHSGWLQQRYARNEDEWSYDENEDDEPESSSDDRSEKGAVPSDDPTEPAKSAPWMKPVS